MPQKSDYISQKLPLSFSNIQFQGLSFSRLNCLPNNKILDWSKLKGFADDKVKVAEVEICIEKGRKQCGKRRKCWLPAFSPFPTMFSKGFFLRAVKCCDCVVKS